MKIRTFIDLVGKAYSVEIRVEDLTAFENEMISNIGNPEVDVGGVFDGEVIVPGEQDPVEVQFTLPTRKLRIPLDFPYKRVFDTRDFEDAAERSKLYADTITSRIAEAKAILVSTPVWFEGETTTTV